MIEGSFGQIDLAQDTITAHVVRPADAERLLTECGIVIDPVEVDDLVELRLDNHTICVVDTDTETAHDDGAVLIGTWGREVWSRPVVIEFLHAIARNMRVAYALAISMKVTVQQTISTEMKDSVARMQEFTT